MRSRKAGLDPAVLRLRRVGLDAEEYDEVRGGLDGVERHGDRREERPVVVHEVVGREDGHGDVAGEVGDAQQRVEQPRRSAPIPRLLDQTPRRQAADEGRIVRHVTPGDDDRLVIEAAQPVDAATCVLEKGLTVQKWAELLGPGFTGDGPRERSQAHTVATGEDQ